MIFGLHKSFFIFEKVSFDIASAVINKSWFTRCLSKGLKHPAVTTGLFGQVVALIFAVKEHILLTITPRGICIGFSQSPW